MAKDYKKLGESIVSKLGGKDNVSKLLHCATRLRFTLKDKSKADLDEVKNMGSKSSLETMCPKHMMLLWASSTL